MLISQHEAEIKEPSPKETPKNQSLYDSVMKKFKISKKGREIYSSQWNANYDFVFGGKQWSVDRPSWRYNESLNLTWSGIMQEIGVQTDAQSQTEFLAQEPSDIPFAKIIKQINERSWAKYDWQEMTSGQILDSKIVHVVHTEVKWNPKLENGIGDIEHVPLDPFSCYWDPQSTSDMDRRWFFAAGPVPTALLKRDYPKKKGLKADVNTGDFPIDGGITSTDRDIFFNRNLNGVVGNETDNAGGEPMTMLIRGWFKDDEIIEKEEEKEDGSKEFVTKKKFPHHRYVEIANGQVLRDTVPGVEINGEWVPYELDTFPIARLVNYNYPRRYAGENEVTHLRGPQKLINYIMGSMVDVMKKSTNPKTIISDRSGDIAEDITDEPGITIQVPDVNTDVRFEPGRDVPGSMFNMASLAQGFFDQVSGRGEISRGSGTAGATSGIFFDSLLEAEQTRPRLKARSTQSYLQRLGRIDLQFYLKFYDQQRVFRITNDEGAQEFVRVAISDNTLNVQRAGEDGQFGGEEQIPLKGILDVKVSVGSALPFAKAITKQNAKELFGLGALDLEGLYDEIDIPNKEALLERMKQAQQGEQNAT